MDEAVNPGKGKKILSTFHKASGLSQDQSVLASHHKSGMARPGWLADKIACGSCLGSDATDCPWTVRLSCCHELESFLPEY